ncbi:MAG: hypothetical protein KatS3mg085_342 [Candidatus Dojkabacteria bacterium]|nr:MAG: hypothetical protein KatS3mg085_342 [Candidatus Dojkabacteria bacterium]
MDVIWNILLDAGVTEIDSIKQTFLLLMMLPIVSTLVGFSRHLLGLKTINTYAPLIIPFAIYEIGTEGVSTKPDIENSIKLGVVLFLIVFITTGAIYYWVLKPLRMHYIPKTTLIVTAVSISVIASMIYGTLIDEYGLIYVNFFTLVMMIILCEGFFAVFARKNFKYAFYISLQTLIISILSFLIISAKPLHELIFNYPILVLIAIIGANMYIGTYKGLRLSEYWRFRSLIFRPR